MDRAELERLDREGLVMRAQAAGLRRARVLTRPELIDELLRLDPAIDQAQLRKSRGFFGIARDLLSRVVERGLHLPDAAERLRAALGTTRLQVPRPEPQAVPTVTLAEIYAAQGHKQRAIETLERVLEAEPDHCAARALFEKLEAAGYVPPPPPLPPEEPGDEIGAHLGAPATAESRQAEGARADDGAEAESDDPARTSNESDDVAAAFEDLASAFRELASFEDVGSSSDEDLAGMRSPQPAPSQESSSRASSSPLLSPRPSPEEEASTSSQHEYENEREAVTIPHRSTRTECVAVPFEGGETYVWWRLSASHRQLADEGGFHVRAAVVVPGWDGPKKETRDVACDPGAGELVLSDLPDNAVVRIAIGVMVGGDIVPFAHSPALERGASRGLCEWTLDGRLSIVLDDPKAAPIARALESAARAGLRAVEK